MTTRKKLIEVALPLEAINEASAREKSIRHGHPSTLHLWWARRPLAACRAVIFASLVDDPDSDDAPSDFVTACNALPKGKNATTNDTPRQRLFDFIERLVQWESTSDKEVLNTANNLIKMATAPEGGPPALLDPFAGGGSIPLEAQRLGLNAYASDLNPVAVMINKALIEIPPKFANWDPVNPRDRKSIGGIGTWKGAAGLAADIRYYGEWMRDRAWERIGHLYPKHNGETVIAWLWARTVKCPNPACGAQMPLISSFELSKKSGRQIWIEPQVDRQAKTVYFTVRTGKGTPPEPPKVSRGANFRCLVCNEIAPDRHVKDEGMSRRMGVQLMAIVTEGKNGRSYYASVQDHEQNAVQAKPEWEPEGELADDSRNIWCKQYGLTNFVDLFTSRQLTALTTFSNLVAEARQQIEQDARRTPLPDDNIPLCADGTGVRAYAEAVSVYLAFAVDKSADYWSKLCSWHNSGEKMRNTFGRQALPMVWDYAEANPFSESTGNWLANINWVWKVVQAVPATKPGQVKQENAPELTTEDKVITISTDPPYYDNISYADLSDFFYVWLRPCLKSIYKDIFNTMLTPKEDELVAAPHRFGGDKAAANTHFETGLSQTFARIRKLVPEKYPLTVHYAFKQQDFVAKEGAASTGWETILNALIENGLQIAGTWPLRTELSNRMTASGTNALASSIALVCRPRPEDAPQASRREFVNALRQELPQALRDMQSGSIAPVDMAQASIGPGMAIYTRYKKVLETDGSRLTVRTGLQLINHELDAYLAEQEGVLDADSRFAVAWFEQLSFNTGAFGQADVLARAKNTSVETVANAGLLQSGAGKVRLYHWSELDTGWDPTSALHPTVWQATHQLINRFNTYGEHGVAQLLLKTPPDLAATARQLAYRLYNICERKGWSEYAYDYNALVISWNSSMEQAQMLKNQSISYSYPK